MILNKIYRTLVGYKSRYDYWSCSDIAHQMQEVHKIPPKPPFATSEGWKEWDDAAKKASPIGYWITEEGLDYAQDIVLFIPDVYHNVRTKLHNIFISKSHVIATGLKKGEWYDSDTRIEHGLRKIIVDFVEIEEAHMHNMAAEFNPDEYTHTDDHREAGLAHLDWAIDPANKCPQHQIDKAKEIKEIYLWIKDIRDTRPDPYDATGWSEYCDKRRDSGHGLLDQEKTEEERLHVRKILDAVHNMEQKQKEEDTEMLIRIVKIREGLWT